MADAVMTIELDGVEYQWSGGAYIEIGYTAKEDTGPFNDKGQPSFEAGQFVAGDVINVYDYEKGEPEISTFGEFEAACKAHRAGEEEE